MRYPVDHNIPIWRLNLQLKRYIWLLISEEIRIVSYKEVFLQFRVWAAHSRGEERLEADGATQRVQISWS